MKKTFDDLIKEIVGENLMAATPQQGQQTTQTYQKTPAAQPVQKPVQPTNQQGDEELLKTLQQKLQDEKFKQQLLQLLNPQQPTQ
jgi:hypothetical protein